MRYLASLFFVFVGLSCFSQNREQFDKYLDTNQYYFVDSISVLHSNIYIAYDKEDESIIIERKGKTCVTTKGFLPCYLCQGMGSESPTYVGHSLDGELVVLIHEYIDGRDSVYVDFRKTPAVITKVVKRSFYNERKKVPYSNGSFIFIAKKTAPLGKVPLPIDRNASFVKEAFIVKPIKWVSINSNN